MKTLVYKGKYELKVLQEGKKMNECFLLAKRITDLNFKFIINRKEKSIVKFRAQLLHHSEIELFAYDELADYIYQKDLSIFLVRGEIRTNMQIEIVEIFN